jgi:protoheme ferro-lyase/xanthosine utilization system XapX-like protein
VLVWIALLAGCVLFGAAIVAVLVLPRATSPVAAVAGAIGILVALAAVGVISQRYDSNAAATAAVFAMLAGITSGYTIAATTLPHLATSTRRKDSEARPRAGVPLGIVLVCCADPERYSPRAVAARQTLYSERADITVPPTALPFVFFAEKARYRTLGGSAPGPAVARSLSQVVADSSSTSGWAVDLSWCHSPESLAEAVAAQAAAGVERIAAVVLGQPESGPLDAARAHLDRITRERELPPVVFGPSIWNNRLLPVRLVERILAATDGIPPGNIGVVLVNEGAPMVWEKRYSSTGATENYFNQRVRVLLGEAGVDERSVRVAWLDWQAPDVTESVRHLAVLGCTHVVIALSTIVLPTLETSLDLEHAVALARVPDNVMLKVLPPWGDDDALADAVRSSALEAIEAL